MVQVNGYSGEIPPQKDSGTTTRSAGKSYSSTFDEYKAKHQEKMEAFKAKTEANYGSYSSSYNAGVSQGNSAVAQYLQQAENEYNEFLRQQQAAKADFYNRQNSGSAGVDRAQANAEYAEAMRNPDNWVEVKAQPAQEPLVVNSTPVETSETQSSSANDMRLADCFEGLSEEAKNYLNNDPQFKAMEQQYIKFLAFEAANLKELPLKQQAEDAAYAKFKNISDADIEAKSAAKAEYFAAKREREEIEANIYFAQEGKEKQQLMKNINGYVKTINNWKDGTVRIDNHQVFSGTSNVFNREYTYVTLENGQKAYEYNGRYYQLRDNGDPAHDKIIK